jgi:hypothetical protein
MRIGLPMPSNSKIGARIRKTIFIASAALLFALAWALLLAAVGFGIASGDVIGISTAPGIYY